MMWWKHRPPKPPPPPRPPESPDTYPLVSELLQTALWALL